MPLRVSYANVITTRDEVHEKAEVELSQLVRRHFSSRTTSLLAPLNRYLNTLLPSTAASSSSSPSPSPSLSSLSSLSAPPSTLSSPSTSTLSSTTLSPSSAAPTPSGTARLKPFNQAAFLASLKAGGAALPFKSAAKQKEFYQRWLRTPAFGVWLARQEEVVGRVFEGRT
jgi:hypothetical protein